VSQEIDARLGQYQIPQYAGVPHAAKNGTDAALSLPGSNVINILPFNTIFWDGAPTIVSVGNGFQLAFVMNITNFLSLFHSSGPGGNVVITFYLYANAVEIYRVTRTTQLNNDETYQSTAFGRDMPANVPLTIGISHTVNTPLVIDMVRSRWWMEQLTPNPRVVGNERVP
jgi:hypothetical protein